MTRETRQSMLLSVLIHGAGVGVFLLLLLAERWLERPEPVVLELVSPAAAPAPVVEQPEPEVEEAPEPFPLERPEPMADLPEIPDAPAEPEPVRERLRFEEWARTRDLPERVQRVERERRAVETPRIETDLRERLEAELPAIEVGGFELNQLQDDRALRRYLARLRAAIEGGFTGSGEGLEAEVEFSVSASGVVGNVRLIESSGDAVFDRRAVEAVQRVRGLGAPPGGRNYQFRQTFRGE